jgi:hypothetical protein
MYILQRGQAMLQGFPVTSIRCFPFLFMKKNLLLLALLGCSATAAQAQSAIPAGTVSLGGNVGYFRRTNNAQLLSNQTSESVNSRFQIAPSVGYFVADNLAIGLNLGYTSAKTTYASTITGFTSNPDPNTTLRVGAYVQYYKMISDQFGLVGTLGGGYQYNRNTYVYGPIGNMGTSETKSKGYYAALTPGIIYFPIPKLGISATVGSVAYSRLKETPTASEPVTTEFDANFGLSQLQFGGTWYFGR